MHHIQVNGSLLNKQLFISAPVQGAKVKGANMSRHEINKIKADEANLRPETLTDLPVADEQARQAKGGSFDRNGHGTHVAGTIGAVGNNG